MSLKLTKETFIEKYLREGVACCSRHRKYLLQFGLKENRCERCGISEWNEGPLSCQLHHINGNRNDNRLENLQFLCPNCHSQTENFQNKNTFIYNPKDKVCKNCGNSFIAKNDDQCYCSSNCRYEYELKHPKKKELPYTKEYMEELCQTYPSLTQMGIAINKSKEAVKRYLILHGLFDEFMLNRNFSNKPVIQCDLDGNVIKEWPSVIDATNTLNIQHISAVCKGKRKSAGGFLWKYKDIDTSSKICDNSNIITIIGSSAKVAQYDIKGDLIQSYNTVEEASVATNTNKNSIIHCLQGRRKQANSYIWKYAEKPPLHIEVQQIRYLDQTPVLMYNTQGDVLAEYSSIKEASESTGICRSNISGCLRGKLAAAGGFIWRYKYNGRIPLDDNIVNRPIPTKIFHSKVPILQYDLNGCFIKEFESMIAASNATGINHAHIAECIYGNRDRAGNFMWKKKEGEEISIYINPYKEKLRRAKPIIQYDTNNNFICEYESMEEAINNNDISRGTLMKCLSGVKASYKDFIWRYK